jgi:hypothetical protein
MPRDVPSPKPNPASETSVNVTWLIAELPAKSNRKKQKMRMGVTPALVRQM